MLTPSAAPVGHPPAPARATGRAARAVPFILGLAQPTASLHLPPPTRCPSYPPTYPLGAVSVNSVSVGLFLVFVYLFCALDSI